MEYKCNECSHTSKYKSNIKKHEKTHLLKFKCRFCRAKFKTENEKQEHENNHPFHQCRECNFRTQHKGQFIQHEATHVKAKEAKKPRKQKIKYEDDIPMKKIKIDEEPSLQTLNPPPPPPPLPPPRRSFVVVCGGGRAGRRP